MELSKTLSYDEFINQGINVSHLCRSLQQSGVKRSELEKLSQQANYSFLPGSRAYYIAEFFAQLWLLMWMGILSGIITIVCLPPSSSQPFTPAFNHLFVIIFIIISIVALYVYRSPDYYLGTDYTRGEQEYYFYSLLNQKFPDHLADYLSTRLD